MERERVVVDVNITVLAQGVVVDDAIVDMN